MNVLTIGPGYDLESRRGDHSPSATPSPMSPVAVAATTVVATWSGDHLVAMAAVAVVGVATVTFAVRAAGPCSIRLVAVGVVAALVLAIVGVWRSDASWAGLAPDELGPYQGWVRLVDDPQPYDASTRAIIEIEGERFEIWSRGRAQQLRVRSWRGGEWVSVDGIRTPLDVERANRVAWQHVVGEFELEWASDVAPATGLGIASNRVRASIERAGSHLPGDDGALFRGLVVGDDRDQPREMIDRFRASGLSHLTAVSGQNVAFVLAAAGPMLRRLRPWIRWAVTLALIGWFVALTRFEPSILRAGVMAALSATAFVIGAERTPVHVLATAVTVLVLVDPLLIWSVGFWLSVGATTGVCTIGPRLARRFARIGLGFVAMPLGITLGAQIGVVLPSLLVFGRLPLVSIPANLLAVPVAGAVMLYGMPAGLVAGWCAPLAPIVMFPVRIGTRWVDTVASLGARLESAPPTQFVGALIVGALIAFVALVASVAVAARRR